MLPSWTASSTPVTVTVRLTFQFAEVNVSEVGAAVPSFVLSLATAMTTSDDGRLVKRTVNVAVPPASVVIRPATGVTVAPAMSSSLFVTATSAPSSPE